MSNFMKIIDLPDCEVIIDVDKVELLKRTATYNVVYIGGRGIQVSDEAYEKIKERMLNPFGRPRKT